MYLEHFTRCLAWSSRINAGWLKAKLFLTSIFSCLHSYLKPLIHEASVCGLAEPLSLSARKGPWYNRKNKKWKPTHLGPQPCPPMKEPFWTQCSILEWLYFLS